MKRLTRVIGARWVVVLVGAFLGLGAAIAFLTFSAPMTDSVFVATATLRFDPAEGETIPDLADEISDARDFALIAAADLLNTDPAAQITIDLAAAKLLFVSQGGTEAEASQKADDLLQSYLVVDPEIVGGLDEQLGWLEDQARTLDGQITGLRPELTAAELSRIREQEQLDLLIVSVNDRLGQLVLAEAAAADADERLLIAGERERLETLLAKLQADRVVLGPIPVAELSTGDALLLDTLEVRKELLNTEYQRLYLRKLGVAGLGTVEGVSIVDFAAEPIDPAVLVIAGLLGGAIISAAGLMMISRTRRTVWLPADINVPVLGQVPPRAVDLSDSEAWYDTAEPSPRKTAVQALRSSVQAHAHSTGSTIAFTAHNIGSEDVQALAADLAGSMAIAGDTVLLIDANFGSRSALGEYRVGGLSLADVLRLQPDAPEFTASIDAALEQAHVIRPGLAVIPSGPPPGSPADALAGRQFRSLISAAESMFDTTIIVVDDLGTTSSQVAMQRLRYGILVTSPGSTTEAEVNSLLDEADRLRISIVGAVFLGSRRGFSGWFRKTDREPKHVAVAPVQAGLVEADDPSPMTRLYNYTVPDERRSAVVEHSPLGDLAASLGLANAGGLGIELLAAMNGSAPERAYEAVANYVISRAEDMVTARYGYGDVIEELIEDVAEYGFLSLRSIADHRTLGSWMTEEIEREVEWHAREDVVGEVQRLLSEGQSDVGIDKWLDREFLRRHLSRTDGDPAVWHLVSPEHSVSLLLPARSLNAERLETISLTIVSAEIDQLERKRKAAIARSDTEQDALYELQILDVRAFERNVRQVIEGDSQPNGKRVKSNPWLPNWAEGTRQNLAPFQRNGLLPFNVLSDEEMAVSMATA